MEISTELQAMSQTAKIEDWAPPLPPTDLIFDHGKPLECNHHRIAIEQRSERLAERLRDLALILGRCKRRDSQIRSFTGIAPCDAAAKINQKFTEILTSGIDSPF